jgi:hypothetical protein
MSATRSVWSLLRVASLFPALQACVAEAASRLRKSGTAENFQACNKITVAFDTSAEGTPKYFQ